jgi:sporulation integral membrane protein YtvI
LLLEAQHLLDHVAGGGQLLGARIEQALGVLSGLSEHIPFLSRLKSREPASDFWRMVDAKLAEIISDTLGQLSAKIPAVVAGIVRGLPGVLVFAITFLLAAFYLCADGERILAALAAWLPEGISTRLQRLREGVTHLGGRYLRAYFLLFLLTFGELVIGLSILRLPYVFLPALLISLVDVLPVLGVGTALIPWGLIELLRGNVTTGTGLLVLCGVMVLLRQLLEPRILGKSIGLHPLATLFAAYVGFELFGLPGMLFGPAAALALKNVPGKGASERET